MRTFFDTNVLLYAYDRKDLRKRDAARAHIHQATGEDGFVVSAQVLAEFYWNALRLKLMGPSEAQSLVHLWSEHDVVVQTPDLVLRAISLHQQHSLQFWDALIVHAALDARCGVLLTEDLQHGRRFGELQIRNPFLTGEVHEPRAASYGKRGVRKRPSTRV